VLPSGEFRSSMLNALEITLQQPGIINAAMINLVVEYMSRRLFEISGNDRVHGPFSIKQTNNGAPELGLGPIKRSAAPGWPYTGTKNDFIIVDENGMELGEEIMEDINFAMDQIRAGIAPWCLYKWVLKDEPVKKSKNDAGKVRVFASGQFYMLWLMRMYLSPFFCWMKKHRDKMPCKVGMNASSSEWHRWVLKILSEDFKYLLDSDYSDFDKMLSLYILAIEVILRIYHLSGWCERDLMIVRALAVSFQVMLIKILETVYVFNNGGASGQLGTAELNSIYELGMEIIVYVLSFIKWRTEEYNQKFDIVRAFPICMQAFDYFLNVRLANYGDDNFKSVLIDWFTPERHNSSFADLGMRISDASDKTKAPFPKYSITEITFLKRGFRFDDEMEKWVAPLEFKSIYKMLTWRVVGDLTSIEHAKIVVCESLRHAFLHGRLRYEAFRDELVPAAATIPDPPLLLSYESQRECYLLCDSQGLPYTFTQT